MTQQLRDALDRLAQEQPPPSPAPDLWQRGRRARRRAQALTTAGVLVVVLAVGGVGSLLFTDAGITSPASQEVEGPPGVPQLIQVPPERLVQLKEQDDASQAVWDERVASPELAVGRASVALHVGEHGSAPLVIGAEDGAYHHLDLPGWVGATSMNSSGGDVGFALSPDGRSLAYGWWEPSAPADAPMPAGVRILDLESGEIRTIALEGGNGVLVQGISWSPDSRWLLWHGEAMRSWTAASSGGPGEPLAGRVHFEESISDPIPTDSLWHRAQPQRDPAATIDSDGVVSLVTPDGTLWRWGGEMPGRTLQGRRVRGLTTAAVTSPDGSLLLVGSVRDRLDEPGEASFVDLRDGRVLPRELAVDQGLYPDGAEVHPLGWIDDEHAVALVRRPAMTVTPEDTAYSELRLAVMSAPSVPQEDWTFALRGAITHDEDQEYLTPSRVSVAVDLMSLEQPTREFPAPEWPLSDGQVALRIGAVAAALTLLLAGLGVWWVSRRKRRRRG